MRIRRPKKKLRDRKRREATQRKRLITLGQDEAVVNKMNAVELRSSLQDAVRKSA
jgi:hypothetical protein